MKAVLSRRYLNNETLGTLVIFNGEELLVTLRSLELPWRDNLNNISCIPEGTYDCEKVVSPNHGLCVLLKDVPNRTAILIHAGNFAASGDALKGPSEKTISVLKIVRLLISILLLIRRWWRGRRKRRLTASQIDTRGCILIGKRFADINSDGNLDVAESRAALELLLKIVPNNFKITIL